MMKFFLPFPNISIKMYINLLRLNFPKTGMMNKLKAMRVVVTKLLKVGTPMEKSGDVIGQKKEIKLNMIK